MNSKKIPLITYCLLMFFSFEGLKAQDQLAPQGLKEMLETLTEVYSPSQARGLEFTLLAPGQRQGFQLSLSPAEAFQITRDQANRSRFYVTVVDPNRLYDLELYQLTGLINLKGPVTFRWQESGQVVADGRGDSFQRCTIHVSFTRGHATIDMQTLRTLQSRGYRYQLDYDANVVELIEDLSRDGSFAFKRKNNHHTSVRLQIFDPSGQTFFNQSTSSLSICDGQSFPHPDPGGKPPSSGWSDWTPWTQCSASCGGGTQTRERFCQSTSKDCYGPRTQTRQCNTHSCQTPPPRGDDRNTLSYLRYINKHFQTTHWPPITKKYRYQLQFQNTHPSRRLNCNIEVFTYAGGGRYLGRVHHIPLALAPGQVSSLFRGTLPSPGSRDSQGWIINPKCYLN